MSDRDRIEPVLDAIRRVWEQNPDLRLGQLLYGAVAQENHSVPPCPPLFYIEDDAMVGALESFSSSSTP